MHSLTGENTCLDTGTEQIDAPTRRQTLYGTRDNTGWTSMCKTPIMPDQQWLNQFGESAEAQRRKSERSYHLHKKYGSMTLLGKTNVCVNKTIKERELKRSCVSLSMSLPRAYEDPHEPGPLGGVEPFAKAHQLKTSQAHRFSNPCSVIRYTNPDGLASLPHPPWYLTVTNNGR